MVIGNGPAAAEIKPKVAYTNIQSNQNQIVLVFFALIFPNLVLHFE